MKSFNKSVSVKVKSLTIRQTQRLIENNGLAADGKEYCLSALKDSLNDKLNKSQDKYNKSEQAKNDEINAILRGREISFPPMKPLTFKKPMVETKVTIVKVKSEVKFELSGGKTFWTELTADRKNYWINYV